jgi:hypothetical protein
MSAFKRRQATQSRDDELPRQDHHHHPSPDDVQLHQGDHHGGDEHLVRQRIQQLAQRRDQVSRTGDLSIQPVREGCGHDENKRRQIAPGGQLVVARVQSRREQPGQNERDHCQTRHGKFVWQVHRRNQAGE